MNLEIRFFFEITSPLLIKNTVLMRFNVGSANDSKKKEGLSHLVEHLVLHVDEKDKIHIEREKKGLFINAFTEKERTTYIASSYILSVEEIAKELIQALNLNIKKESILKEIEVISTEILQDKEDSVSVNFDKALTECVRLYGKLKPYKHSILGTEKSIKNISLQDIKDYIDTYYINPSISTASSKPLDKDSVNNIFSYLSNKPIIYKTKELKKPIIEEKLESKMFEFVIKNTQIFGICLNNSNRIADDVFLSVLKGYLAYNWSSVCNQKMRLEKQLVYFVNNYCQIFKNFSVLYITYDVSKKNREPARKEYLKIVKDLQNENISMDVFEASKSMLLSLVYDSLGNEEKVSDDFLFFNQDYLLNNGDSLYTIEDFINSVKKLSLEDFTKYVKNIFKN